MYRDGTRYKSFTRRVAILGGGKLALLALLGGRMYQLQVLEADKYLTLAEDNRINLKLLLPPRGRILDRNGTPIAENRENYRLLVTAEQADDLNRTLDMVSKIVPIGPNERARILREISKRRSFVPVTVRENLDWREVAQIEVNAPDLPGVSIDVGQSREYPYGDRMAHILGYVAKPSERDLTGDPLLELPGFRIGKSAVEKIYDTTLRGRAGTSQVEVNAVGREIRELNRKEGQAGFDVGLTIDMDLQMEAYELLAEHKSASAVVMDVNSGDLLAMASVPAYDPNAFAQGLPAKLWRSLVSDPLTPLINKSIAGQYAPGSTFKMIVLLAALEAGVIDPNQRVFCRGHTNLGNARFHCWKRGGHGWMDAVSSLEQSCDVYFYDIGRQVGVDRITEMAKKFGLGTRTGIEIPGEKAGLMPTRAWKRASIGVPWQLGETLVASIGQGFVLSTPLQLAVMTARLANGGRAVVPRLVHGHTGGDNESEADAQTYEKLKGATSELQSLGISKSSLDIVLEGMYRVVNGERGTARAVKVREEGMEIAGKTGTSQVRRISKRERETRVLKNHERPWIERDHALFVGYGPVAKPRYAVSVLVAHGGSGSKAAAPIASALLKSVQERDPSGTPPSFEVAGQSGAQSQSQSQSQFPTRDGEGDG